MWRVREGTVLPFMQGPRLGGGFVQMIRSHGNYMSLAYPLLCHLSTENHLF